MFNRRPRKKKKMTMFRRVKGPRLANAEAEAFSRDELGILEAPVPLSLREFKQENFL